MSTHVMECYLIDRANPLRFPDRLIAAENERQISLFIAHLQPMTIDFTLTRWGQDAHPIDRAVSYETGFMYHRGCPLHVTGALVNRGLVASKSRPRSDLHDGIATEGICVLRAVECNPLCGLRHGKCNRDDVAGIERCDYKAVARPVFRGGLSIDLHRHVRLGHPIRYSHVRTVRHCTCNSRRSDWSE